MEENKDQQKKQGKIKGFDLEAFYADNDILDEKCTNEKLIEANKRLPKWSLVPPTSYKK